MTGSEFKSALQQLRSQLDDATRLRKEFDTLRQSIDGDSRSHAESTKGIIANFLKQAQAQYAADMAQLKTDRAFCEQVRNQDRLILEKSFAEQSTGFPTLASAFADYLALREERIAQYLEQKSHPAQKAADIIRGVKAEKRTLNERCRVLQYLLLYYEELFPALADYREIDPSEHIADYHTDSDDDPAKEWLSADEYDRLPRVQKFQLALDRYWNRRKSSWQLGRDYERYVGYHHEIKGYEVVYQGIIKGLEDCGRDLICRKDGETVIVQCKYWAQGKVVREKHINQLFGTCVEYWVKQTTGSVKQLELFPEVLKSHRIVPRFITSTVLSDTAKQFAAALGIHVVEGFALKPYPCIKCNVSRIDGERIYHLPFDQQYDSTVVEAGRNEFYAQTVAEAEAHGFRRAFKWHGEG